MLSEILFETEGGTELLAMHKYEPISLRAIFVSFKLSPRNDATGRKKEKFEVNRQQDFSFTMSFRAHRVFQNDFVAVLTPPSHNRLGIAFTSAKELNN